MLESLDRPTAATTCKWVLYLLLCTSAENDDDDNDGDDDDDDDDDANCQCQCQRTDFISDNHLQI